MIVPLDKRPRSGPYSGLNVNSAKRFLMTQFREAGLDTPDIDARLLVMAATGFSHSDMIARGTEFPPADVFDIIASFADRRLSGEPIDSILGHREFYGRAFKISKDVLSPRPETEMLVDAALEILSPQICPRILDLGTGSGAIIISIVSELLAADAMAVDVSERALAIARKNAQAYDVTSRLDFRCGSWFKAVTGRFDLIISNPPYITAEAMQSLSPEVANFDPYLALSGGSDGLEAYRKIIKGAPNHLVTGGYIVFEIGYDQGVSVSALLTAAGFNEVSAHKDLAGHDRMVKAVWQG